ncbi:MAG: hypothetical protein J6K22_08725 [Spirochaetaceae bacterium]|nr:hypothetical protein [Spirochaetaceae bacterium]
MKLGKILGTLLVLLAMFVFVGCGEDPFEFSGDDFHVWVECYDDSHENTDGIVYAHEGDSYTVSLRFGSLTWSNDADVKYEIHEKSAGVVKSWDIANGSDISYTVDIGFDMVNAGETKEFEYWATVGEYYTSEKIKVIVSNLEPLILVEQNEMQIYDFPGKVKNNEYSYVFDLISHNKNSVKFTKDTEIKQFTRLKGDENFTEKTVTGIYTSRNYYPNGHVEVTFDFPEEYVNKEIELYYEYEGLKSNIITVKTLNYYFDIKVTDVRNHEISDENPLVVYADATTSLKFDISLFGPDGEIEDFEYTFTDMFDDSEIKNYSGFIYELPDFDEYNEWYKNYLSTDLTEYSDYNQCRCSLRFKYTIESDEYSGDIYYLIDLGVDYGNKHAPVYYWYIPAVESARALFTGGTSTWQKADFLTTLTLTADGGSLNYGTFVNDCLDDNYDFEGTYIINPLEYTAKAIVELDGEEKTFEIELLTYYDSDKEIGLYDTAFSMDLSSLGLSESEIFIKKTTTTPDINGEYSLYSDDSFSFTIDKNTMSYRFRQSDETKSLGTFTIEGNQITLDPLGDRPEFVGKKAIFSKVGVALQYYDSSLEEDATVYLPKSSDANLELWINNENTECGFDWESNTALLNDHEISIKNKTDDGFDLDYSGETVPCSKIEDDVYEFDPTSLGGVISYFVKAQFEDFDFNGTWTSSDGATLIIDDTKETEQLVLTVGEYEISSTYFLHSGNMYKCGTENTNFLSEGVVSASGTLYISYQGEDFDTTHELSSLILTKQQ